MANNFVTTEAIAKRALARLYNEAVLAQIVHRDYESEFQGGPTGGKVVIRKPATFEATEFNRATGIVVQDAVEDEIVVELGPILDTSFRLTDEVRSLTIDNFDERLIQPAMESILQGIEKRLLVLRDDIPTSVGTGAVAWNDPKVLAKAGAALTARSVPLAQRYAVVGPEAYSEYITRPPFDKADSSGSTAGLREASLGRAYGFDTFQSAGISTPEDPEAGDSTTEVGMAFHRSAFALVTRTLPVDEDVTGAVSNYKGFGIRVTHGWDQKFKQKVCSLDLMVGTKTIDANRAVLIKGANA